MSEPITKVGVSWILCVNVSTRCLSPAGTLSRASSGVDVARGR